MSTPVQPNLPFYKVSNIELFPEFTRKPSDPPFVVTRRPKYWADPDQTAVDPAQFVSYLVLHQSPDGTYAQMTVYMPAAEAATANFPDAVPDHLPVSYVAPVYAPKWESPIRPLLPNEVPYPTPFGLQIKRTDIASDGTGFSSADRLLLEAIAAKVGVGS